MPVVNHIYYTVSEGGHKNFSIVLIHGAGSNRLCWHSSLRRLVGYRVMTVDLPGHGNSGDQIGYHSIQEYSDRLIEFLLKTETYQAVLVGHSMGGVIAMNIALKYPQIVTGLGLIASAAQFNIATETLDLMKNDSTIQTAIMELEKRGFSPATDLNLANLTVKGLNSVRSGVLYGDWNACSKFNIQSEIKNINSPTWIAVGADDLMTPVTLSRYMAEQIPNSELHIIPDAGHMVILEKPLQVSNSLLNFIQKL